MTDNLPERLEGKSLELLTGASTPEERRAIQAYSLERVEDERFERPVPRFLTELPFAGDDDEITDRIAGAILVAEDPTAAQEQAGTTGSKDVLNKTLTIWDLRVNSGALEGGWGAYLLLDVSLDGEDEHFLVNTGSKQIITHLANRWAYGQLPIRGAFAAIGGTGKRGNAALAFITAPEPFIDPKTGEAF
jgi:hypothetical protein